MKTKASPKLINFFSTYREIKYKDGETILRPEDDPQGVYFIKKGFVSMNRIYGDGKMFIFNIFKPGTYFPVTWAIGDINNNHYFVAKTKTVVLRAPKDKTITFLENNPLELMLLTKRILIGLDGILNNIQYMLCGKAYHRVVGALYLCSRRFGENNKGGSIIKLPLTHQEIANIAGISRETVSIIMKKLEKKKIIDYKKGQIFIKDIRLFERKIGEIVEK